MATLQNLPSEHCGNCCTTVPHSYHLSYYLFITTGYRPETRSWWLQERCQNLLACSLQRWTCDGNRVNEKMREQSWALFYFILHSQKSILPLSGDTVDGAPCNSVSLKARFCAWSFTVHIFKVTKSQTTFLYVRKVLTCLCGCILTEITGCLTSQSVSLVCDYVIMTD